jgi:hypothetical protein
MAAFSQIGIRPWEIGLLTVDEFKAFIVYFRKQEQVNRG